MSTTLSTVGPHTKLQALVAHFAAGGFRHLPVVDDAGLLVGLVTQRDLASRALGPISWLGQDEVDRQVQQIEAREVMTSPVATIGGDATLGEAAERMIAEHLDCLPVVEGGRLVGLLTEGDFVRIYAGRKAVPKA